MKNHHLTIMVLSAGLALSAALAQDSQPTHDGSADVASVDSIIAALYDVLSGPPGARDWDRFRNLFADDARLTSTGFRPDGTHTLNRVTPDGYIERSGAWLEENGFYEIEIARTLERFGPVAHAFSTYEMYREKGGERRGRGINSIQLIHDGERWSILSIFWTNENEKNPIPEKYLP
jgi:hypothetical protein